MARVRTMLSAFSIIASLSIAPLAAQTTTGALRGTVVDTSGAVLPGVTIELSGERQIGEHRHALTADHRDRDEAHLGGGERVSDPRRVMLGLRFEF